MTPPLADLVSIYEPRVSTLPERRERLWGVNDIYFADICRHSRRQDSGQSYQLLAGRDSFTGRVVRAENFGYAVQNNYLED